jgi:AcrR family transcriptional regulator
MAANSKKTGPRQETLERRTEILKAAAEVFGSKGYNNGPLTEIAEQAGMTHAGILHHFGSKNKLLVEVLKYRDAADVEDKAGRHIPDGEELFRHLIETALRNESRPGLVQAYAVLSAESVTEGNPGRDYFDDRYRTLRNEIVHAFIAMCQERGISDVSRLEPAAASILAVMDGMQVQWLLDRNSVELARTTKFAIEALVSQALGEPWASS